MTTKYFPQFIQMSPNITLNQVKTNKLFSLQNVSILKNQFNFKFDFTGAHSGTIFCTTIKSEDNYINSAIVEAANVIIGNAISNLEDESLTQIDLKGPVLFEEFHNSSNYNYYQVVYEVNCEGHNFQLLLTNCIQKTFIQKIKNTQMETNL